MEEIMTTIVLFITLSTTSALSAENNTADKMLQESAEKAASKHDISVEVAHSFLTRSLEAGKEKNSYKRAFMVKLAESNLICAIASSVLEKFPREEFENATKVDEEIPKKFIIPLNEVGNAMSSCHKATLEVHAANSTYHQSVFQKECSGSNPDLQKCGKLADKLLMAARGSMDNIELWTPITVPISLAQAIGQL